MSFLETYTYPVCSEPDQDQVGNFVGGPFSHIFEEGLTYKPEALWDGVWQKKTDVFRENPELSSPPWSTVHLVNLILP
jgi:hypothetical protein